MKIYFAGSIRGGRDDAGLYAEIVTVLQEFGTVLTEHVSSSALDNRGEHTVPNKVVHDRDLAWLFEADVVVAEVTTPSLGVGYELGRMVERKKPILCLFRPSSGRSLSPMISGCQELTIKNYEIVGEARMLISDFLNALKKK